MGGINILLTPAGLVDELVPHLSSLGASVRAVEPVGNQCYDTGHAGLTEALGTFDAVWPAAVLRCADHADALAQQVYETAQTFGAVEAQAMAPAAQQQALRSDGGGGLSSLLLAPLVGSPGAAPVSGLPWLPPSSPP